MDKTMAYACKNIDSEIRLKSSSGGVFYALADNVISQGGIVFGARFNEKWEVVHSCCYNVSELKYFMGSKYAQSQLGNVFLHVKSNLNNNRQVMFVGTPCQIGGLLKYLGHEYDNLILVDFVCHGVPSPKVWQNYLHEMFDDSEINEISFRDKTEGWQRYSLRIVSDKFTYQKKKNEDWYMKGFLKNIYLRPSCYECAFKGKVKESDFTLADFWGVEEILPEFYDKSGVSLLFVHSEKGMNLWRLVQEQFVSQEVSMEMALEKNRVAFSSSVRPSGRNVFFSTMGTVQTRVKKATEDYFWLKVIKKLRKLFRIERKRV
ncbi:Coenzyme F420 hydrogenase/dehydrogenase, beta subunit C-terminal domain [Eisenbergiella porci]|uniref:Coenzyme F420 hydrogenase/dehydrogenase, beta subunit C-terminal domain n=1 Tax=Eisenbergiella porci TaxID=2652274 RepID=UPI0022DF328C|nr:Coenzyme F420 hydrogenase/dehydrogenase, beta subunit C-terminal domain [Eisenbergiella porci]